MKNKNKFIPRKNEEKESIRAEHKSNVKEIMDRHLN